MPATGPNPAPAPVEQWIADGNGDEHPLGWGFNPPAVRSEERVRDRVIDEHFPLGDRHERDRRGGFAYERCPTPADRISSGSRRST